MRQSRRRLVIYAVALALVLAAPLMSTMLPASGSGPYMSSLSIHASGQAIAAPYCNDKYCAGGSRHNIVCAKVVGYHCANLSGGYCTSNPC